MDFIACSFVSQKQDLIDVRTFLREHGDTETELIAKIENRAGIENIEEICEECSGIMIGRGDMGVEIPFEELPAIQKHLITKCRLLGKRVITATEMLESMIQNVRPTRAEISDVANAVYDGTSAIMLSGETAVGKHPALTVETMARIAAQTEKKHPLRKTVFRRSLSYPQYRRRDFTRNLRYGDRYRRARNRRLFPVGHDRAHGFAVPAACRYFRHHDQRANLAQAGALLGRNADHVRGIQFHRGTVLYGKASGQRNLCACRRRPDRHHRRRDQRTFGQYESN